MDFSPFTEDLIPALEQQGFKTIPLDPEDKKSPEIRNAFPFGRMMKTVGREIHLLEIQIDKRNPKKYRINIGKAPATSINHPHTGQIEVKDLWVRHLPEYYEAYAWPFFRVWLNSDVEKLFPHLIKQTIDILEHGKIGSFIRKVKAYNPPAP
jgi:hypothetical protein